MARVIAVVSQKGGVGKTTTVLNLGYSLSKLGQRVLLVDLDPQGALLLSLAQEDRTRKGLAEVFAKKAAIEQVVITTAEHNLELIGIGKLPAMAVSAFERALSQPKALKNTIAPVIGDYDFVLLDCPSGIGGITTAALTAADSVIVVMLCDPLSLRSLPQALELMEGLKTVHKNLELEGILLNQHQLRVRISSEVAEQVWDQFPQEAVFQTVIPRHELFGEASAHGVPLARMGRKAQSLALKYTDLAREVLTGGTGHMDEDIQDGQIEPLL